MASFGDLPLSANPIPSFAVCLLLEVAPLLSLQKIDECWHNLAGTFRDVKVVLCAHLIQIEVVLELHVDRDWASAFHRRNKLDLARGCDRSLGESKRERVHSAYLDDFT